MTRSDNYNLSSEYLSNDTISFTTEEKIASLNYIAYQILMPTFLVTGIVTNAINIFVLRRLSLTKNKKHKDATITYRYLWWLAVGQVMSCLSVIPSIINLDRSSLTFAWAAYYAHFEILVVNSISSSCIYIILGLSIDRFIAVCKPHTYRAINGDRNALARIVASFMLPPVLYTPLCFFQKVHISHDRSGYTPADNAQVTEKSFWQFWSFAVEACHRLIPAILVLTLNMCIMFEYRRVKGMKKKFEQPKASGQQITPSRPSVEKHDIRLYLLLMGVIIVFLSTTLPSAILGTMDTYGHGFVSLSFEVFRAVANLMEVLGFSLNFFLYFFLVPEVKKKIHGIILCRSNE